MAIPLTMSWLLLCVGLIEGNDPADHSFMGKRHGFMGNNITLWVNMSHLPINVFIYIDGSASRHFLSNCQAFLTALQCRWFKCTPNQLVNWNISGIDLLQRAFQQANDLIQLMVGIDNSNIMIWPENYGMCTAEFSSLLFPVY